MSKKAPDTRNKLESIKAGPKKKSHKPKKYSNTKQLADVVKGHTPDAIKLKLEKKPTKGQIFKQTHGYSKTMKRLIRKHLMSSSATPEDYKPIRRERKLKEKKARQEKHKASVTYKRLNGKKKGGAKQSQPAKKSK